MQGMKTDNITPQEGWGSSKRSVSFQNGIQINFEATGGSGTTLKSGQTIISLVRSISTPTGALDRHCKTSKSRNVKNMCPANSGNINMNIKSAKERQSRCPPYGVMCFVGKRGEMEDTVATVPSFYKLGSSSSSQLHFFGVYDGHGGSQVSALCKDRLHEALAEELTRTPPSRFDDSCGRRVDWEKVMKNCFNKMDMEIGGVCPTGNCYLSYHDDCMSDTNNAAACCRDMAATANVGSTAVVAVVSPSLIIVANCGDSRAVLCRGGKAIPLSNDHKADRKDEMDRIEASGGKIIYWDGYRVGGLLAMSRALGDRFLKEYVISEPEVSCTERTDEDELLILASDGLWDVISNKCACEVAGKCLAGYRPSPRLNGRSDVSSVAALLLTKVAVARGSTDNISIVVVDLKKEIRDGSIAANLGDRGWHQNELKISFS